MAIVRTPMVDDDGSGETGTVINNAWKTELYNQIDGALLPAAGAGPWKDITGMVVADDNSTPLVGTYSVNRYRALGGNTLIWNVSLNGIVLPGPSANLYVGQTPFTMLGPNGMAYPVATAPFPAFLQWMHGTALSARRQDGVAWAAGAAWLYFSIILEASGG